MGKTKKGIRNLNINSRQDNNSIKQQRVFKLMDGVQIDINVFYTCTTHFLSPTLKSFRYKKTVSGKCFYKS